MSKPKKRGPHNKPPKAVSATGKQPNQALDRPARRDPTNEKLAVAAWRYIAEELVRLTPLALRSSERGKHSLLRIITRFLKVSPARIQVSQQQAQQLRAGDQMPAIVQLLSNVPRPQRPPLHPAIAAQTIEPPSQPEPPKPPPAPGHADRGPYQPVPRRGKPRS